MRQFKKTTNYGYKLLGPIFYRFCYKLFLSQGCHSKSNTHMLFLSRGGVRLRLFYEEFMKANKLDPILSYTDFYLSRMSIIKSTLYLQSDEAVEYLANEYCSYTLCEMLKCFLNEEEFKVWRELKGSFYLDSKVSFDVLRDAFFGNCESSIYLNELFRQQNLLYNEYLTSVVGAATKVIVVDTGWSGSILNFMMNLDSDRTYLGLFFGRYNYGKKYPQWFKHVLGLEVQAFNFDAKSPITSIFLNRHLIEGVCEIRWPSVTGYKKVGVKIVPFEGVPDDVFVIPDKSEGLALGIHTYLKQAPNKLDLSLIDKKANQAANKLCRKLLYPSISDAYLLTTGERSADFGKNVDVSYFVKPIASWYRFSDKINQVNKSLWHAGQLAIEFGFLSFFVQHYYHTKKRRAARRRQKLNK